MLRRIALGAGAAALALSMSATITLAGNPAGTGQPNVSCDSVKPVSPNGFLTAGFAAAALIYANPGSTGSVASGNTLIVVSQYDVACIQLSQHQH